MSRHAAPRNLIVCDEVLSAAGIKAEEIDFAYDTKEIYDEKQTAVNAKKIKTSQSLEKLMDVMLKEEGAFSEINPGMVIDMYIGLEKTVSSKELSEKKEVSKTGSAEGPRTGSAEGPKTESAEASKNAEIISHSVL